MNLLKLIFKHASPWIHRTGRKGETSFGIQWEFEWEDNRHEKQTEQSKALAPIGADINQQNKNNE